LEKNDVLILNLEFNNYCSIAATSAVVTNVQSYWKDMELQYTYLSRFAKLLLSIRPHAARIEGLFSSLSLIKSKARNRLNVENLVNLGRVKIVLQEQVNELKDEYSSSDIGVRRLKKQTKKRKTDYNEDISNDDLVFSSTEENQNEEVSDEAQCDEVDDEEKLFFDSLEEELNNLINHEQLVGNDEEDLKFLEGLFDYINFNNDGIANDMEREQDLDDVKEPEETIDEDSWDIEDLMNSV